VAERVQLKHLLLDVGFPDNPKIIDLTVEHGELAAWYVVRLMLSMSQATNGEISRNAAFGIGGRIGFDRETCIKILAYCLSSGVLSEHGPMLTNSRVIKDQESCATKREAAKVRQQKLRESRVTSALPPCDKGVTPVTDPVTDPEDLNNKETVTRFLILDPIALDQFKAAQGADVVERAIELAEADIEKKRLTPDYSRLINEAKSGIAFLKAWPLSRAREQLYQEEAAATRLNRAKAPPKDFDAERKQKQKEERERWAKGET
jgi:hypothetical protein